MTALCAACEAICAVTLRSVLIQELMHLVDAPGELPRFITGLIRLRVDSAEVMQSRPSIAAFIDLVKVSLRSEIAPDRLSESLRPLARPLNRTDRLDPLEGDLKKSFALAMARLAALDPDDS